jgi:hypothetical protein
MDTVSIFRHCDQRGSRGICARPRGRENKRRKSHGQSHSGDRYDAAR